jgi:hypothetical protein
MVASLMDGRAGTGRELARAASVTPSTASVHLSRLVGSAMVSVVAQGRHRYYRIASPEVAHAIESLMVLAPARAPRHPSERLLDAALRRARTCYDHLAGVLGVLFADALQSTGSIAFDEAGVRVTPAGVALFGRLGVAYDSTGRRPQCRACLDWSERRWHLAGSAGAALCRHALENNWVERRPATRALEVTARGIVALRNSFGIVWTAAESTGSNGEVFDDAMYPLHA